MKQAGQGVGTQAAPTPRQLNDYARALVLAQAIQRENTISSQVIDPTKQKRIDITPRNVGLIKGFEVEITFTANNTDGAKTATLSDLGLFNVLSGIVFKDLNNFTRIDTAGWHLGNVDAAKHYSIKGGALLPEIDGGGYGDNFACLEAPASIAPGESKECRVRFFVPLAYSNKDLRGAIYANVINAQMSLQLTLNDSPFADAGADSTLAVYKGAPGNISDVNVEVVQVYLDQLPRDGKGNVVLPALDLGTVYELKNTALKGISVGNDFPIPYANLRDFLSTFVVFNHDPSADAGRVGGTDVNHFSLQAANFSEIWKLKPTFIAEKWRRLLKFDFPKGMYYFDSREKPISTLTYGNMQLNLNASVAAAGAQVLVGWEDVALTNTLTNGAGSLA